MRSRAGSSGGASAARGPAGCKHTRRVTARGNADDATARPRRRRGAPAVRRGQNAITALIHDEIADDRRGNEAFARSPGKLASLAARAAEQMRAGPEATAYFFAPLFNSVGVIRSYPARRPSSSSLMTNW